MHCTKLQGPVPPCPHLHNARSLLHQRPGHCCSRGPPAYDRRNEGWPITWPPNNVPRDAIQRWQATDNQKQEQWKWRGSKIPHNTEHELDQKFLMVCSCVRQSEKDNQDGQVSTIQATMRCLSNFPSWIPRTSSPWVLSSILSKETWGRYPAFLPHSSLLTQFFCYLLRHALKWY